MRILVTAGGGGHFSSALGVMEVLKRLGHDMLFVGRAYTFEGDTTEPYEIQVVKQKGIAYKTIDAARLQRSLTKHTVPSLMKLPKNLLEARLMLLSYTPDVVVSFGGTVSLPVVFASSRMGIPVVIHEQAIRGGIANKVGARFAKAVCLSWDESKPFFRNEHKIVTGLPLREEIYMVDTIDEEKRKAYLKKSFGVSFEKPVLYITGGSGGSHMLNLLAESALAELLQRYEIVHQTGDAKEFGDFDRLSSLREKLDQNVQKNYMVRKFVSPEEASYLLSTVDLVAARSGMNTTSELIFFQKKALLFPLQLTNKSEQLINAKFYADLGLGDFVTSESATKQVLLEKLQSLLEKNSVLKTEILDLYRKRFLLAADTIVTTIQTYAQKETADKTKPQAREKTDTPHQ